MKAARQEKHLHPPALSLETLEAGSTSFHLMELGLARSVGDGGWIELIGILREGPVAAGMAHLTQGLKSLC